MTIKDANTFNEQDENFEGAESADGAEGAEELYERFSLVVDKGQEPMRLDKFLVARIEGASRNKVQQSIETGRVTVNGKTVQANHKIKPGEEIIVYSDKEMHGEEIIPEKMPLNIVFEDDDILIVNKPVGLVVHPASGNPRGTLINGVAWHLQQQNSDISADTLPRFGLVHRIDKNTSGLMVLAKTEKAVTSLAKEFFDHTIHRQYVAMVWGDVAEDSGTVRAHIGRHQRFRKIFDAYPDGDYGKDAVTHYKVLERLGYVTIIQCELETGRTHQIRVHMKHLGHPLFNDELYGGDRIVKGTVFSKYKQFVDNCFAICPRHALHAKTIGFIHPRSRKEVVFNSEMPEDMQQLFEKWRGYAKTRSIT
ncbi:RluA family pseudouridine synthase [Longitalea luteola]|uniref:RluA family pseudouridine synthase n=1 Tax=Longitalea luteola TaxID=2812563 RepID=UPI001A969AE6|nr:RluA family pseudouridine synthase [Longitalea luteola]